MLTRPGPITAFAVLIITHLVHRFDVAFHIGIVPQGGYQGNYGLALGLHVGVETQLAGRALIHIPIHRVDVLQDKVTLPCPRRLVGKGVALDSEQCIIIVFGHLHRLPCQQVMVDVTAPLGDDSMLATSVSQPPHGDHRVVTALGPASHVNNGEIFHHCRGYGIKIWDLKVYAPTDKDIEHPDKPAPAPKPELGEKKAAAVFCDAIAGGPAITIGGWGQNTEAEVLELADGDNAYYLSKTNYVGWELNPAVDASGMSTLHVDLYSTTMSALSLTPISEGPKEGSYTIKLKANEWNSVDIPLSAFAAAGIAWDKIFQFKFMNATPEGSTIYIDNVYFYGEAQGLESIQHSEVSIQKVLYNGQVVIIKNGVMYTVFGAKL